MTSLPIVGYGYDATGKRVPILGQPKPAAPSCFPKGAKLMAVEEQQGWQPERCAGCGHTSGEHKSGGGHGLHRVRRGVCLVLGCDCQQFEEKPSDG